MNRQRNRHQKTDPVSKLDEFPDDFDDVFFHNQAVEQDKKIPVLRNIVYKKIKNAIIDRVSEYKNGEFPLEDKFTIDIETSGFTEFQLAVVREELLERGFDARFNFDNNKIKTLTVPIERTISLTETLDEKEKREQRVSEDSSDEESDIPNLTSD